MSLNLYLPASKVSSFCSHNKFIPQEECFFNAFKKNNSDEYSKLLRKLKREDKNEQNKRILKKLEINDLMFSAVRTSDNKDRSKVLKTVEQKIKKEYKTLPDEQQKKLIKNVKKQADTYIKTEIGTKKEETSLDKFEDSEGVQITSRNDETFYGHIKSDNVNLKICGKIDGVNEEEKTLIEHKQRMNRLFDTIPLYEKWQLMLYMHFTGMENSILIQSFKDQQIKMEFQWSDEFFEIMLKKIRESLEKYYKLVSDPKRLERLIRKYTVKKFEDQKVNTIDSFFNLKSGTIKK